MHADDVTSGRQPLLRPDGSWDHVALAAWFQDDTHFKVAAPDDEFSFLGPRAGDLLITDAEMKPYVGGLLILLDEMLLPLGMGLVDRDYAGRLCVEVDNRLLPVEGEGLPEGMELMVVGYLHLRPDERPNLVNLLRAQTLPLEMLHPFGAPLMPPQDLPF